MALAYMVPSTFCSVGSMVGGSGESPTPPVDSYPVDLILLPTGTNDALVTTMMLNNGTIGDMTGWAWTLSRTAEHTRIRSAAIVRRAALSVAGVPYDGDGYKSQEFDLDEALSNGSTPLYEWQRLTPPAGLVTGITLTCLVKPGAVFVGPATTNFDLFGAYVTGGWGKCQIQTYDATRMRMVVHGQLGVASSNSGDFLLDIDGEYSCTLRINQVDQKNELLIIDNETGEFIGCCEAPATIGEITYISREDYDLSAACSGYITIGEMGIDYSNAAFPLEPITVPVPTDVFAVQSDPDEVLLTYVSKAQRVLIERRVNSGAWSTLVASFDRLYTSGYTDSTVTDGNTYEYRVRGLVGDSEQSALSDASNAVLINNAEIGDAHDDFSGYDGDYLGEPATPAAEQWAVVSGLMNVAVGDKVYGPGVGAPYSCARITVTFTADQRAEATISSITAGNFQFGGLSVRCQSGAETFYSFYTDGSNWFLNDIIAGSQHQISTGTSAIASGDKIAFEATGAGSATRLTVQKYQSGVWTDIVTNTDPGATHYIDDGFPGVTGCFGSPTTGPFLDDWKGFDL